MPKQTPLYLLYFILIFSCSSNENNEPESAIFEGDIIIHSQNDIDALNNKRYTHITGDLKILTEYSFTEAIDLSIFNNLITVEGNLAIENNDIVTHLDNFKNLEFVGEQLSINNNPIKTLTGLSNLKHVGALNIQHNALTDLRGLENLEKIEGAFIINQSKIDNLNVFKNVTSTLRDFVWLEMESLTNLTGLPKIETQVKTIYLSNLKITNLDAFLNTEQVENLVINNCDDLENLQGFQNIKSISGSLNIRACDKLKNLDDFSNLSLLLGQVDIYANINLENLNGLTNITTLNGYDSINDKYFDGKIYIQYNDKLTDLSGIRNINTPLYQLVIYNNPMLSDFCPISDFVNIAENKFRIQLNAYNPTQQDFLDGNCSL